MGLRAMFSGISGLQAHSTWLDVIGNNISNVNTVAYKSSRVEFADQVSQSVSTGSGPSSGSNLGGVDPQQVGLGTKVASIQTLFTQGPTLQTGITTDIALQGSGFLMSKSGNTTYLTRAGNLTFDGTGNLVDQNGGLIQGYTATTTFTTKTFDSNQGVVPPGPLMITSATLALDTTSITSIGNIKITSGTVLPAKATTVVNFVGNLDSFQQANTSGGVLNFGNSAAVGLPPILPLGDTGVVLDAARASLTPDPITNSIQMVQIANLSQPQDPANPNALLINNPQPLVTGAISLPTAKNPGVATSYAWDQQPPVTPAKTAVETVYDSLGNPREVTFLFYQVNDLGTAGVNVTGSSQVAYAWYAFDTTGGNTATTPNLVGGTGIFEGDNVANGDQSYDRGINGDSYWGDLLYFNTDGSLASEGGVYTPAGGAAHQSVAHVYLPPIGLNPNASPLPTVGAEVTDIAVNFGTAGILTKGSRDGLFSDAQGSFQTVSGVSTYVASSTAAVKSQDGYADGTLQSLQFNTTGQVIGSFSNGQNVALAQVAMANVDNEEGLSKVGSDYFAAGVNSGSMTIGLAGQNGFGTIQGGALEGSNVDLTVELSNMIIAQRGFEVNARVIAVTNQNLQTLTQLGQGG